MSSDTRKDIIEQKQEAAVAQETGDSVSTHNSEHGSQVSTTLENSSYSTSSYSQAYSEQCQQFREQKPPLPRSGDTTAFSEEDYVRTLSLASSNKCTALTLGEDLQNEAAKSDRNGVERIMELRDELDALSMSSFQGMCGNDRKVLQLAALILSKLCQGEGGSTSEGCHTESDSQRRHPVAGYAESGLGSHVTGWVRGGGLEERPNGGTLRDVSMDLFPPTPATNTLPSVISQFNPNTTNQPPHSLEETEEEEVVVEYMSKCDELLEPSFQTKPTEETATPSLPSNPVMEETQSGNGQPVFTSNPAWHPHLPNPTVIVASFVPRSQSYEDMTIIAMPEYSGKSGTLPQTYSHECSQKRSAEEAAETQHRKKHGVKKLFPWLPERRCNPEVKLFLPYVMNKKQKHGLVLIIANENFRHHPDDPKKKILEQRLCARADIKQLSDLWTSLGYRVRVERDCTAEQIRGLFDEIQRERSSAKIQWGDDSFICCISSHGTWDPALGTDVVFGVEGAQLKKDGQVVIKGAVDIRALAFEKLSYCRQLKDKPKLFFIQACRRGKQGGVASSTESRTDTPPPTDFLFMHATAPGKQAYHNDLGSFFIADLCALLTLYVHKLDLISIFQALNNKETVIDKPYERQNAKGEIFQITRQYPSLSSNLRGPVFFSNEARKHYKKCHGF